VSDNTHLGSARLVELESWKEKIIDVVERLLVEDDNVETEYSCVDRDSNTYSHARITGYACRACCCEWVRFEEENHAADCPRKVLEQLIREQKKRGEDE